MTGQLQIPEVLDGWLRQSVLAAGVEPFLASLDSQRYASSTIRRYVCAVAHLARWLTQEQLVLSLLDEALLERFIKEHMPQCECPVEAERWVPNLRAAGRHFLAVLRRMGSVAQRVVTWAPALAAELAAFDAFLDRTRGLAVSTRGQRQRIVADFLTSRFGLDQPDVALLTARDIHAFMTHRPDGRSAGTSAVVAGALRSYLRFCGLSGQSVGALLAAVPAVAQWPLDRLPQALDEALLDEVERTFDPSTAGGLRDRAMFRLMLDLGLRVSEVAALQLDDIDWRAGLLRIRASKVRRVDQLPLTAAVTEALVAYVSDGRPQTTHRALFVRKVAPVAKPVTLSTVRGAMRQAYARCGHPELNAKTHVLRHTAASRMLRDGMPLKRIADVLRHRSLDTTTIYAKVDRVRLAAVAMPWPESQP